MSRKNWLARATALTTVAAAASLSIDARAQTSVGPPATNQPSTVQLYGILDVAAYNKQLAGEAHVKTLTSGGMTTSRWGITGNEDLGGGLRGVFDISGFIRVDTGQTGRNDADPFFARYSYVGLSSPVWGAVRLGRITTATFLSEVFFGAFLDSTTFGPYLLQTFLGSATQPMITPNGFLDSAWSNSISYSLPTIAGLPGLTASVQAAASEGTLGRRLGGGVTYRSDVWGASFTLDDVNNAAIAVGAPTPALATIARPQYTANKVRTYQGGTYVDFKVVRLWAQGNQTTFTNNTTTATTTPELRLRTYALSATVPFGLASAYAEWSHTTETRNAVADQKRNTVAVGYDYFLSKRTDLYAAAIHDRVTNLNNGTGLSVGVRHRF